MMFVVNLPIRNIEQQFRNRVYDRVCTLIGCVVCPYGAIGGCMKIGIVYRMECMDYHAVYVGETDLPLG